MDKCQSPWYKSYVRHLAIQHETTGLKRTSTASEGVTVWNEEVVR
jgi:hypothetical protein